VQGRTGNAAGGGNASPDPDGNGWAVIQTAVAPFACLDVAMP
jgi:hypothetical protein